MTLELNMVYYNIQLNEDASNLCTIIIQWIKYCYYRIQMGVSNSSDIFHLKIKHLFQVFQFIFASIDDFLILINIDCKYHVHKLELTLSR